MCAGLAVCFPTASFAADLTIVAAPEHNSFPGIYEPGSSVALRVNELPPNAAGAFQWLHNDLPISGANTDTLRLANLSASDSGNYQLKLTTPRGVDLSNIQVINVVALPPVPLDPTFTSDLPQKAQASGFGPFAADGSILVDTVQPEGRVVVQLSPNGELVGETKLPSDAGSILGRLSDGSLLISKHPYRVARDGSVVPLVLPPGFTPAAPLSAGVVAPDGSFYIAQVTTLSRLSSDGTVDPSFAFSEGRETSIQKLVLDHSSRLYVYGTEKNPVPSNFPMQWTTFYRVTPTGLRDPSFTTQTPFPMLSGGIEVTPLANGKLLYYSVYHGSRLWRLLNDDGTVDPNWTGSTVYSESRIPIDPVRNLVYVPYPGDQLIRYRITSSGLEPGQILNLGPLYRSYFAHALDPNGFLLLAASFDAWSGHPTRHVVRFRADAPSIPPPPRVQIWPDLTKPPRAGQSFTLLANISVTPLAYQWLALDGQPLPADNSGPRLVFHSFQPTQLGRYQLRISTPGGSVLSNVFEVRPTTPPYLAALSGRATTGAGESIPIAGVTIKTIGEIPILLRAIGPGLEPLGVRGFVPNPALNVFDSAGALIANNDQWSGSDVASAMRDSGAFALRDGSYDAATVRPFGTRNLTIHLQSQDGRHGVGLLEIYRIPNGTNRRDLLNLSFRAQTSPGEGTAIAGFVIEDPQGFGTRARLLLRAVGPTLSKYGVTQPLADPVLQVFDRDGVPIASNDNWASQNTLPPADLSGVAAALGAAELPADSKDAALIVELPPGPYTMHATGGTGVVLLEIYSIATP